MNHLFDEAVEIDLALPPEEPFSLCRIAKEQAITHYVKLEAGIKSKGQKMD